MNRNELELKKFFDAVEKTNQFPLHPDQFDENGISHHISLNHYREIFKSITSNASGLTKRLESSVNRRSILLPWGTSGFYLTIGIVVQLYTGKVFLFFHTNRNKANNQTDTRLKDEKFNKEVSKSYKKYVKRGYYWTCDMAAPSPIAIAVLSGPDAVADAEAEEKYSYLLGPAYANRGFMGQPFSTFVNDRKLIKIHYYSPLAACDFQQWTAHPKKIPPGARFLHLSLDKFLAIFLKILMSMVFAHQNKLIIRDFKFENFLVFFFKEMLPQVVLTDLSTCISIDSETKNDKGTLAYCAPEHDYFVEIRKLRYEGLELTDFPFKKRPFFLGAHFYPNNLILLKLKKESHENKYQIVMKKLDEAYKCLAASMKNENDRHALNCIYTTDDPRLLSPDDGKTFYFPPDQKDDFWSFCVSMKMAIDYWGKNADEKSMGCQKNLVEKLLWPISAELSKNLRLPRSSRKSSADFLGWFWSVLSPYKRHLPVTCSLNACLKNVPYLMENHSALFRKTQKIPDSKTSATYYMNLF